MSSSLTTARYHAVSQVLHWLMASLIVLMLASGLCFSYVPPLWRENLVETHKATGLLLFILLILRLLWRLVCPPPPLANHGKLLRHAATVTHGLLYSLMFGVPLSGLLMVFFRGKSVSFFHLVDVLPWVEKNRHLAVVFRDIHTYFAYGLLLLVGAHVAAVAFHSFVLRDKILKRML